ncbi:cytosolic protein [Bacillus sp. B1-b2]|uniref:cytosolic protein n=1 Tax=Bacillus sp. B1-b2 TaxID=2653201 RepID=UPI0012616E07|nr:cytosolic protein [Bacillus sp. B1-b2]KAB7673064.1 cytosolic protein [Bacillus sp. B1-b2]
MKEFKVQFHAEDGIDQMTVQKLSEEDFNRVTSGGTRQLFELDTNIGFFIYFDAEDEEGNETYLVLQYEEESEDPSACFSFQLKDFYQFVALHLNDLQYEESESEEEEDFGPIHYLAHLMHHIVEDGKTVEV